MAGGWTMSMVWMQMPGQTWPEAAAWFIGMWVVMTLAMMLPSLAPILWRYRQAVGSIGETRRAWLTTLVGAGYFSVWTLFGAALYCLGVALAAVEMRQPQVARAVPTAAGVIVVIAGATQFTALKAHHLACCRAAPGGGGMLPADAGTAWRHGLDLGRHCTYCCASFAAVLLAIGVMDLRAMALLTAGITVERLTPRADLVGRVLGILIVGVGLYLITRATGLGGPVPVAGSR